MDWQTYEKAMNDIGRYATALIEHNRSNPAKFTAEEVLRQLNEEYDRIEQRYGEWPYKSNPE